MNLYTNHLHKDQLIKKISVSITTMIGIGLFCTEPAKAVDTNPASENVKACAEESSLVTTKSVVDVPAASSSQAESIVPDAAIPEVIDSRNAAPANVGHSDNDPQKAKGCAKDDAPQNSIAIKATGSDLSMDDSSHSQLTAIQAEESSRSTNLKQIYVDNTIYLRHQANALPNDSNIISKLPMQRTHWDLTQIPEGNVKETATGYFVNVQKRIYNEKGVYTKPGITGWYKLPLPSDNIGVLQSGRKLITAIDPTSIEPHAIACELIPGDVLEVTDCVDTILDDNYRKDKGEVWRRVQLAFPQDLTRKHLRGQRGWLKLTSDEQKRDEIYVHNLLFSEPDDTKLAETAANNDLPRVKELLTRTNVNNADQYGYTALHGAIEHNNIEMIKLLLKYGADVNVNVIPKQKHVLREEGYKEFPLEDFTWLESQSPLFLAVYQPYRTGSRPSQQQKDDIIKIAKLLIDNGANVNDTANGSLKLSLLQSILGVGDADLVDVLLNYGKANANVGNDFDTPLLTATEFPINKKIVQMLLDKGADVHARERTSNETPLHNASKRPEPSTNEVVEILLNSGAEIDAQDKYGYTALMYAVRGGNIEKVTTLLRHGANVALTTHKGDAPLDIAVKHRHLDVAHLLMAQGAIYTGAGDPIAVIAEANKRIADWEVAHRSEMEKEKEFSALARKVTEEKLPFSIGMVYSLEGDSLSRSFMVFPVKYTKPYPVTPEPRGFTHSYSTTCTICHDANSKEPAVRTKCKHRFHNSCLQKYDGVECPYCKANLFTGS